MDCNIQDVSTYFWPCCEDSCIVLICNIIYTIDTLNIAGRSGRLYKITDKGNKKILDTSQL